ncbi:reverse transcriptase domain, reverse transcriptase zinc-binding domain protein [Tanacetum coccineum]
MRRHVEGNTLLSQVDTIRWNATLPIKVNIHTWRTTMDRLPTRYNLDVRGIDLDSTRYPVCDGCVETSQHLFIDLDIHNMAKESLDVVIQTTIWIIWQYRNRVCFDSKPPCKDTLGEDVMIHSHSWIKHRNKNMNPIWLDWIADPIAACTNRL